MQSGIDNAIVGLSVSGTTVTYTRQNGDSGTITTQNTDTKVTQNAVTSSNHAYPVILGYNSSTAKVTNVVNKAASFTYNPSSKILNVPGTIVATTFSGALSGNAATATYATSTGTASTAGAFAAAKSITLSGDIAGTSSSTGGWAISTTLASTGVASGSYGLSAAVTPAFGSSFNVPYITVDTKGRITSASTHTVKLPSPKALKIGSKSYTGSSEITITAADLGVTGAMVYKGTTSTEITDGGTQAPTIGGSSVATSSLQAGNVVLYGSKEFVWNGSKWELLGDEGSYKVKQTAVASPSASGNTTSFIDTISQDTNGNITATKKTVSTVTQSAAGLMSAEDKKKLDGIAAGATANTGDITGVTAGNGLTGGGSSGSVTLNVGAGTGISVTDDTVALATSGVTAGTYGPSAAVTGSNNATMNVPEITVDAYGRVTKVTNRVYTAKNSTYTSLKNPNSLTVQGNGTQSFTYDGSAAKTLNIKAGTNVSVASDTSGNITINATDTTYNNFVKSGSRAKAGLVPAPSTTAGTTKYLREDGTWQVPPDTKYTLPTASSSTLGGVKIGSNINISSGVISVPAATKDTAGVTVVYPAASCTSFSSDSGTITPAAAQKAAKQFAIPRPNYNPSTYKGSATDKAITRYSGTEGEVQDSKILIEDVTNTKDNTKKAQVISIPAEGGKKMVYGYCTDQTDGTSFIGGVFNADATEYPYAQGLAIGGTSGNLLWKGKVVATTDQIPTIPTSLKNPNSLTIQGNGTTLTNGVYDGSAAKTVNITPSAIGAAPSSHTHDDRYYTESETNTKLNAKLDKLTYEWNKEYSTGGTAGYLLIGSFPMYDSNVTIDIDATTNTTYHGTVVIATQNVSTTSIGSAHTITVYNDPTGAISNAIRVTWASGSRNYNVYFVPSTWSKNLIHIRAIGQYMDTIDTTKICTQFTAGTAPAMTSGLTVVNALRSNFNNYTHPTTSGNKHIPAGGSSGQILRWSADGTAVWGNDNNTTYSAGTGISLSGTTFSNSGVRSIATGSANGTISVNTNGTTANVAVKGLGTAAYKNVDTTVTTGSANLITSGAVKTAIEGIVDSAPGALDTLNELAAALGDDANFATTVTNNLASKVNNTTTVTGTNGLTGGGALNKNQTISADLLSNNKLSNAARAATETAGRVYPVAMDKNGKLAVNVPWSNTTYSFTNSAATLAWGTSKTIATVGGTNITVSLPSNPNTDSKVAQVSTVANANYHLLFANSSSITTSTAAAVQKNANLYYNPSTQTLNTTKLSFSNAVTLSYNSADKSLDFIFA